jgi:hypothetical protein
MASSIQYVEIKKFEAGSPEFELRQLDAALEFVCF